MGEARRRGTREERKAAAIARNNKVLRHYGIDVAKASKRMISNIANQWPHLTRKQQEEVLSEPENVTETGSNDD